MRTLLRLATLCLLGACVMGGTNAERTEPQLLRLVATDHRFAAPATIPAGLTRVRLVNQGHAWHEALITRLPEGQSAEAYLAGARAGEAFPVAAVDLGGPGLIARGDSAEVVLQLPAGRYAIVCWSDDHVKAGMIVSLTVSAATSASDSTTTPAGADIEVTLREYRFEHVVPFRRGHQTLRVRNAGQRPHNMQIHRLEPGRTLQGFGAWFRTRQGEPPATPIGGVVTMAPGREVWVPVTLVPGRYFIACATPEGDKIHAQLGMLEEFEVP